MMMMGSGDYSFGMLLLYSSRRSISIQQPLHMMCVTPKILISLQLMILAMVLWFATRQVNQGKVRKQIWFVLIQLDVFFLYPFG
jgi:hypothetical protein